VDPIPADPAITNIVLAGNDVRWPQGGRTDALLIVSINRETKQAAVLSLPRDLYVYIPGWTMNRINLALPHGHGVDYPGGGGGLLADTIEHNFGLSIDHYARLGFDSFSQAVDTLGGVAVVVNCPLTDWRLISPELDPEIEENWERFTLEPGIQEMDGDLALWYARSRRSTNDFDRGRRQQQLLGAILAKGVSLDLVDDVPELWQTFRGGIETDLSLPDLLALAALAPVVNENGNGVQHLLLPAEAFQAWRVPVTGEAVQLPRWDVAQSTFESLVSAPSLNRGQRPPLKVEVITDDPVLFRQAAENLSWHGLETTYRYGEEKAPAKTQVIYHGPTLKGSFHWLVAWLFGLDPESVVLDQASDAESDTGPDARSDTDFDYTVILGPDYSPCLPDFLPPAELFE
jgi:LCP family protein required for cell wall assembly